MILAFFASALGRKILIYTGIAVALFFAYRWWSNRLVEQGRAEGRLEQLKADEKILREEQEKAQATIDLEREHVAQAIATADANRAELRRIRADQNANLEKALAAIRAGREVSDAGVDTIPGTELDDAIRLQLRRLATPAATADGARTP